MKHLKTCFLSGVSLACALLLAPGTLSAQNKGNYELAERFNAANVNKMVGSTSVNAQWLDKEDKFWYQWQDANGRRWTYVDVARKTKRPLFNQEDLAAKLSEEFNRGISALDLPLTGLRYDKDNKMFTFHVDSIEFKYNAETMVLTKGDSLKREERNNWGIYSPDSTWIVFARKHNLYAMRANDPDSNEIQLTTDGELWNSYQASNGDTVTTRRLRARATWFKDSKKLYVKRQDQRKVPDLWVINTLANPRPTLNTYKYNMPGDKDHYQDELAVIDVNARAVVKVKAEKWPDQSIAGTYFGDAGIYTPEKNSDHIFFLRRSRTWDEIDVCKADTRTGEVTVLWSETSKPYFNTRFTRLNLINDGQEFIWWSQRTGWGQLYLYDSQGKLKNRITTGNFMVGQVAQIDTTGRTIYFSGYGNEAANHPYHTQYFKVKFDGSGFKTLTSGDFNHTFNMSESNKFYVTNFSNISTPTKSVLRDSEGRLVMDLESADVSKLASLGYHFGETVVVKADDGVTDLYGVMWKPADFDSTKKYPIISYVYPGPQTEPFPIGFQAASRHSMLAQAGFIVVALGNRGGNPIRHKSYHQFGYDNLRDYALADNKYGIEQLAARHSFIDISRVGIYGHSGGGFMSSAALLTYPDFYKVSVSSAGNHDNNIYNIWWGEVHHGVKATTRKVKEKDENGNDVEVEKTTFTSRVKTNAEIASNLKGRLLLVHGEVDNNVHPANTYRLVEALIRAGKRFDLMIFPGAPHGFSGRYATYFESMLVDYFAEHLLGDTHTNIDLNLPPIPRGPGGGGQGDD